MIFNALKEVFRDVFRKSF